MNGMNDEFVKVQRAADGPAAVLALGTAVPPNVFLQKDYPDFYFDITNSNHQTALKSKFTRMCKQQQQQLMHPSVASSSHVTLITRCVRMMMKMMMIHRICLI